MIAFQLCMCISLLGMRERNNLTNQHQDFELCKYLFVCVKWPRNSLSFSVGIRLIHEHSVRYSLFSSNAIFALPVATVEIVVRWFTSFPFFENINTRIGVYVGVNRLEQCLRSHKCVCLNSYISLSVEKFNGLHLDINC